MSLLLPVLATWFEGRGDSLFARWGMYVRRCFLRASGKLNSIEKNGSDNESDFVTVFPAFVTQIIVP